MKKQILTVAVLVLAAMTLFVGCSKQDNAPTSSTTQQSTGKGAEVLDHNDGHGGPGDAGGNCPGTTLTTVVDGGTGGDPTCFNDYSWTVTKSVATTVVQVNAGTCVDVPIDVNVSSSLSSGVSGTICVTNGGERPTEGLKVGAVLETKEGSGQFEATAYSVLGLESQYPVLAPGESHCYTYSISSPITPGANYRVSTDGYVTITNHSGHCDGVSFGPSAKSNSFQGCGYSDECATVTDANTSIVDAGGFPLNMTVTVNEPSSLTFTAGGETSGQFTMSICNNQSFCFSNSGFFSDNLNLVECTSNTAVSSNSVSMEVTDIPGDGCSPPPQGCTLTIGYYKTHAGVGNPHDGGPYGHNPDMVSQYLPMSLGDGGPKTLSVTSPIQVVDIMKRVGAGGSSNGILKLYSQLLAAKFNLASGSDASCISGTISAADAFLSTHDANDWAGLSNADRASVNQMQGTLGNYNNGLMCSPHCE